MYDSLHFDSLVLFFDSLVLYFQKMIIDEVYLQYVHMIIFIVVKMGKNTNNNDIYITKESWECFHKHQLCQILKGQFQSLCHHALMYENHRKHTKSFF